MKNIVTVLCKYYTGTVNVDILASIHFRELGKIGIPIEFKCSFLGLSCSMSHYKRYFWVVHIFVEI